MEICRLIGANGMFYVTTGILGCWAVHFSGFSLPANARHTMSKRKSYHANSALQRALQRASYWNELLTRNVQVVTASL